MLIARLTLRGTARVLDGAADKAYPVHSAFQRTDGQWVITIADFCEPKGGHLPFQPWTLGDGDYSLWEATYDVGGWTFKPAPLQRLALLDRTRSSPDYVKRFPEPVRPYVDRIYQEGFEDGAAQTAEAAFRAGHSSGRVGGSAMTEDEDWEAYVKEQG